MREFLNSLAKRAGKSFEELQALRDEAKRSAKRKKLTVGSPAFWAHVHKHLEDATPAPAPAEKESEDASKESSRRKSSSK